MHTQSQASGLQLLEINSSFLDSLVLDYLAEEDFVEDDNADTQERLLQRLAAFAAYQQLQQGSVHNAMAIAKRYCPAVLEDQRLAFRLQRQQFIELLRKQTTEADGAALACAREELAPLALYAYPEAFLDFKKTLLMLVDTQQTQVQPQAQQGQQVQQGQQQQRSQEWSLQARQQLAETLYHTMLLQMGCQAPSLSLLLRYLLHLYQQHTDAAAASSSSSRGASRGSSQAQQLLQQAQQLAASKGGRLAQGVLLDGRDEGPLPPDVSGQQPRSTDVQALMAAVGLQRREAEDALKLTGGDVGAALAHQLGRLRVNVAAVDCMVWEYATAKGLLEPADGPEAVAAAIAAAAAAHLTVTDDMDIDTDAAHQQEPPQPTAAAAAAAGVGASAAVAGGAMPPPANRSTNKRSKAAISSAPVGGSSSSPFRSQQGLAAAEGSTYPLLAVQNPGQQAATEGLNRSASQSPPYKAPRYRRKQTPSRFYAPIAEVASPEAAAAAQQQQQQWGGQLQEVLVLGGAVGAAAAATGAPTAWAHLTQSTAEAAAGGGKASSTPPSSKAQPKGSSSTGGGGGVETLGDAVQQLVMQARATAQQQRWQQLQQQLKGQSAAGVAAVSEQLEAQQQLSQVQVLLQDQQYVEAEALLQRLAPGLLQEQHQVMFELKRCQFTALVASGGLPAALQLARGQLTPLADQHPELLPRLKSSMAVLLPGSAAGSSGSNSGSDGGGSDAHDQKLWDMLLPLLQDKLGVEPPQLVLLMQVLLTAHKAWFVRQRCSDPFAATLNINKLQAAAAGATPAPAAGSERPLSASRGSGASEPAATDTPSAIAAAAAGVAARLAAAGTMLDLEYLRDDSAMEFLAAQGGVGAVGHEEEEEASEGEGVDEAAVLQVMEVLELPRGTALELLAEHGGDAQAVIMAVFGG